MSWEVPTNVFLSELALVRLSRGGSWWAHIYIYIWLQSFKYNIRTKSLMSNCFNHKATFPDTHRHFRPAIEISRKIPIVCEGLELKKSNLENKYTWMRNLCFSKVRFGRKNWNPHVKKTRVIECTVQNSDCIWIVH